MPFFAVSSWLVPYLALAFIGKFALTGFEGTFALHAKLLAGFVPSQMGCVFMTCGFVMAAGQAGIMARLTTRMGEVSLLCMGFLLMSAGLTLLMTTERFVLIIACVAILALGMAFVTPTVAALVSKAAGQRQGAVLGQLTAVGNLAQARGPLSGGMLCLAGSRSLPLKRISAHVCRSSYHAKDPTSRSLRSLFCFGYAGTFL